MAAVNNWVVDGVPFNITATSGTVTRSSATQCKVVINASWTSTGTMWGVQVTSGGGTANIPSFDGKVRKSGSGQLTGTYTVSKNVAGTIDVTVTFKIYDDTGKSATKSLTLKSVSVPAWTSYTVSYNVNGGSGAPGNQTKWKDQTLTLSTTKPTRAGYSFLGWSTSSTATSATYAAGGSYTANAGVTLYAVWKPNEYKVTYNANGGSGAPSAQTKKYGTTLKLSSVIPSKTNYNFKGWATSASATTATYAAGGSYTANAGATLYAVWELAYSKPRITNLSVVRCDSNNIITDEGEYVLVTFDWACDQEVDTVTLECRFANGELYGSFTMGGEYGIAGKSGSFSNVYGYDQAFVSFDANNTYVFTIVVRDSIDSYSKSVTLNGLVFPIDFSAELVDGKPVFGAAFGKPAERKNVLDIAFVTNPIGGFENPVLPSGTDLDEVRTPNAYVGENVSNDDITYPHCPLTSGTFTLEVFSSGPNGQTTQRLTGCDKNNPQVFERTFYTNEWGSWYGAWVNAELYGNFVMYGEDVNANFPRYRKDGRIVEVRGAVKPANSIPGSDTKYTIFQLPDGYRPSTPVYTICQGSSACTWLLEINTNGNVNFSRYRDGSGFITASTSVWLPFHVTFFAK